MKRELYSVSKLSSIEKISEQIEMLSNQDFVEKEKVENVKKPRTTPRKVILEEPTITSDEDLMQELIGENTGTKVFAKGDINPPKKFKSKDENIANVQDRKWDFSKEKVKDFYLPALLIFLIILFFILILVI